MKKKKVRTIWSTQLNYLLEYDFDELLGHFCCVNRFGEYNSMVPILLKERDWFQEGKYKCQVCHKINLNEIDIKKIVKT